MKYVKKAPVIAGWYWVKWANYSGFITYLEADVFGTFCCYPGDGKTKVYLSDDENHWYSEKRIEEPKLED